MIPATRRSTTHTWRTGPFPLYLLLGAALLGAACGRSAPSGPLTPGVLALHPGESLSASGEATVTFVRVDGDSRCPSDVQCVWSGNAGVVVTVRVGTQVSDERTLNTHLEPHSTDFAGIDVRLDSLLPYPVSTRTIDPDEYLAYFTLSRPPRVGPP